VRGRKSKPASGVGIHWREARRLRGWTLDEASRQTGIAQQTISSIERGDRPNPTKETLIAAAEAYAVPVTYLMTEGDPSLSATLATMVARGDFDPPLTPLEKFKLAEGKVVVGREPSRQEYLVFVEMMRRPTG
jgi:transcriptional regulator with XRE-family HTH domain